MATVPGQTSGTYLFDPSNAQVVMEAFDEIGMPFPTLQRHHFISARNSLNLELVAWNNKSVNVWDITSGTIPLVAPTAGVGQAVYTLPANLMMLTELWFSTVNGNGAGINQDRWMEPITRTQYAQLPNKLQPGQPTQYFLQRLVNNVQISIYQTAFAGAPNYVMNWYGLLSMQDAGIASGETPYIPTRAYDALITGLAVRLARKFKPERYAEKKAIAEEAWIAFTANDEEPGPLVFQPNMGNWARIGR